MYTESCIKKCVQINLLFVRLEIKVIYKSFKLQLKSAVYIR